MTTLLLVRHGETVDNVRQIMQGQTQGELTPNGIEQARALAAELKDTPIDVAISSPLERSYMTCSFCADLHGLPVLKDDRLLEINHGDWEGKLADEIEAKYPEAFHRWHTQPHTVTMPGQGGESLEDVRVRARAAFDDYVQKYDGKTVLVAAHDAVNKAIICDILGLDMSHFWQIKQDNTCINVLECQDGVWRLVLLNSTNHMGYLFSGIEQKGL